MEVYSWGYHLNMEDFPLPCLITGGVKVENY
jgi:hypothetical protein